MFEIEYKGGNTIVIISKKTLLVTDPKQSVVGLKDYPLKQNVIAVATEARLMNDDTTDALVAIEGPGEYEISDYSIRGIAAKRHIDDNDATALSTIYRVEVGDVRIAILGNIDEVLNEEQLESLGLIDIIIVPVGGGGYTLDNVQAAKLVRSIEAKVVIPIHYADNGIRYEVPQDDLDMFLKNYSGEVVETAKFKVKAHSSLPQVMTIVKLTRS